MPFLASNRECFPPESFWKSRIFSAGTEKGVPFAKLFPRVTFPVYGSPFVSKDEVAALGYHISKKPLVINHKREW